MLDLVDRFEPEGDSMTDMLGARRVLLSDCASELVGPARSARRSTAPRQLEFPTFDAAAGPYRQASSARRSSPGDRPVQAIRHRRALSDRA